MRPLLVRAAKTLACALCLQAVPHALLHAKPARSVAPFEIGTDLSHYSYEEPGVMKISGVMIGLSGAASFNTSESIGVIDLLRIEAAVSRGSVDYSSPADGTIQGIHDSIFEARGLVGKELHGTEASAWTLMSGFGFRQLHDNEGGLLSSRGNPAYDRESRYSFIPVVLELSSLKHTGWGVGGMVEYDYFLSGTQHSQLTDANNVMYTYSDNLTNRQHNGYGLRASLKVTKKIHASTLLFEPFVRYWSIGDSDRYTILRYVNGVPSPQAYIEPQNHTTQYGLKVSLLF